MDVTTNEVEAVLKKQITRLARQCKNLQQFNSAHHVTYVCERS
jgi:hypothetical protein